MTIVLVHEMWAIIVVTVAVVVVVGRGVERAMGCVGASSIGARCVGEGRRGEAQETQGLGGHAAPTGTGSGWNASASAGFRMP